VRWLLRYLAIDVKTRAEKEALYAYKTEWRTRSLTKLVCVVSSALFAVTLVVVVLTGIQFNPALGVIVSLVLLVAPREGVKRSAGIVEERWRFTDDQQEYERVLAERQAEHQRWSDKLDSLRPDEREMENWLTCDKTAQLDEALRHYKLAWRDIIAHAFLQTPADSYKRARSDGCPWRYSRYDMRLFLVTNDGMREYRADLDFEHVTTSRIERNNFRFDAVSSIGVVTTSRLSYVLKLTLTNGPSTDIRVVDPTTEEDTDAERERFSEINLDAAGFKPALHILEGIAAEGKGWIARDPQASGISVGSSSGLDESRV
jgi:hypothetical protein